MLSRFADILHQCNDTRTAVLEKLRAKLLRFSDFRLQGPLRISAGGAAPLSTNKTDTTLWLTVRSLRRFAFAALSSSAPSQPPLRLESYPAGWLFISLGRGEQARALFFLAPRPAGVTEVIGVAAAVWHTIVAGSPSIFTYTAPRSIP